MTHPYSLAIIQARMDSSRLPDKVLLDICGKPMLIRVIERTLFAKTVDEVVIATSREASDDPIQELCQSKGYNFYRGSMHDVLDRYFQAALKFGAEIIVRITADCPLIDPELIDRTVNTFLGNTTSPFNQILGKRNPSLNTSHPSPGSYYDFVANRLPPPWGRTYPIGLDTEVCTLQGLETAWKEAQEPHQREHVMPFFYDHQERFRTLLLNHDTDYGAMRWTVDTYEDLILVREIFDRFPGREDFTWLEVLDLILREPKLAQINAQVRHKAYNEVDDRQ